MRLSLAVGLVFALVGVALLSGDARALHRHRCAGAVAPVWTTFGCWGECYGHHARKEAFREYFGCKLGSKHGHKHWYSPYCGWGTGCYAAGSASPIGGCYAVGCTPSGYSVVADYPTGCIDGQVGGHVHDIGPIDDGATIHHGTPVYDGQIIEGQMIDEGGSMPGVIETPAPPAIRGESVPPAPPMESAPTTTRQTMFRISDGAPPAAPAAAAHPGPGAASFNRGLSSYRGGSYTEAMQHFASAVRAEPANPLYRYHQALAMFEISGADAARETLDEALRLEREQPISGWGRQMERIQGRARAWVETARREAGLSR
jgi:hypothetical protein